MHIGYVHIRIVYLNKRKLQMHYFDPAVGCAFELWSICTIKDGLNLCECVVKLGKTVLITINQKLILII